MKLKYYLRGVGIGLIVATLILMIASALHSNKDMSDEEIIARAEELGMVMKADAEMEDKKTLADLEDPDAEETDEKTLQEDAKENPTEDQTEDTKQEADNTKADQKQDTAEKSEEQTQKDTGSKEQQKVEVIEKVEVTIVPGEYSDKVSKKLLKAGLIDDAEIFNKYLAEKNYDNLIQPGNYEIPKGSDYDAIIKIITEKKKKS